MRTSVVLAVVAAALLGYILVFERGSISSGEREQRKGSALSEFVRARVAKLEIQRKGVTIVLARDPDADVEDDAALWRVEAPYRAKADQEAVDTLLGELEWLDGRRKLEGIGAEDRKRFGFDKPRYRVWFTVGKTRVPVVVGNQSPRGDGVYVSAGQLKDAWVVGKNLVEALDAEPGEYHTKELHDGIFVSTAIALSLTDAQGERGMRKGEDELWRFERGATGLASTPAIAAIVDALDGLRARRFAAQGVEELARYGLDRPRLDLRVRTRTLTGLPKDAKAKPERKESTMQLRVGGACVGHTGESYVAMADARTVHCAADEDLSKLAKPLGELREARLLPLEEGEVSDVQVTRGDQKLALTRTGETWSYALTRAGKPVLTGEARPDAALDWLKALAAVSVARFDAQPLPGQPTLVARFGRGKDRPAFELRAATSGGAELIAQRGDEAGTVAFAASAADLLAPEAARFRALAVRSDAGAQLERLEVRRRDDVERLQRSEGMMNVEVPVRVPADAVAVSEIARLLGSLEAVRFAADSPAPTHELSSPAIVVTAEFTPRPGQSTDSPTAAQRVVLNLGATTEGGRFAELEGTPGVFVVSSQLSDLLSAPLASRTLLATPLERLRAVEVEQGAHRVRIERSGERFAADADANLGGRNPQAIADAVATLRALRIAGYGAAAPEYGLQRAFAKVSVVAKDEGGAEQRYTVAIGNEVEGGRYARRDDQAITFVLPKAAIESLVPTT
jgi:hypothetical protein